jgi:hypothetical protein
MSRNNPEAAETEPRTEEFADLRAQAQALAERVEKMHDGPRKEKLRSALYVIGDEIKAAALIVE